MEKKKIIIIDETLREGMQYRGLLFSKAQRLTLLEFQEKLKVDVCQAGYPSAHQVEADIVRSLCRHAQKSRYGIRVAAIGRATVPDAAILMDTGVRDLHFHLHIKNDASRPGVVQRLDDLLKTIESVKKRCPDAVMSIAMLDIGRSENDILEYCISFLSQHIPVLSLPDTSGILAPNQVFEKITVLSAKKSRADISIHCHNDMGMASANTVMGILAGGTVLEASALGIGERNGIADLYTTAKTLKDQGVEMNLDTDDIDTFKAYYETLDAMVFEQTHHHLLTDTTPVFGDAVKTHVAGTHAGGEYGMATENRFFVNGLCGRHLVKKYLNHHHLDCPDNLLDSLTLDIKAKSFQENRCLTLAEIKKLIIDLDA